MQDLAALEKSLGAIAAAFKLGGVTFLIAFLGYLTYKIVDIMAKRQHKASQEVNVTMPAADVNGGASGNPLTVIREHEGRISRVEGGIITLTTCLEMVRTENRQDHQKLFEEIASSRMT